MFKILFIFFDFAKKWQCLFQDPATSMMENIIDLHHDITFFLIVIITLVIWMLFKIFVFFNDQNYNTKRSFFLTHNTVIEIIWTIIPTIILLFIALPSYTLIYKLDEMEDPRITLKIIGHQWYWSYEYSDYNKYAANVFSQKELFFDSYMVNENDLNIGHLRLLEVDNNICLPVNTTIRLLVTAADVIHSWTIPSLGVKMDAVPGRLNQVGTYINRDTIFYGQCSELCGLNHSFMPIGLKTATLFEYLQWYQLKVSPEKPLLASQLYKFIYTS